MPLGWQSNIIAQFQGNNFTLMAPISIQVCSDQKQLEEIGQWGIGRVGKRSSNGGLGVFWVLRPLRNLLGLSGRQGDDKP